MQNLSIQKKERTKAKLRDEARSKNSIVLNFINIQLYL